MITVVSISVYNGRPNQTIMAANTNKTEKSPTRNGGHSSTGFVMVTMVFQSDLCLNLPNHTLQQLTHSFMQFYHLQFVCVSEKVGKAGLKLNS
jgi:hypothetical protein